MVLTEEQQAIGGGLTGCEIAYDLILKGKKPSIVEMKNDLIAVKGVCLANSSFLREMLVYKKAPVYLGTTVREIRPDGVTVTDKNGGSGRELKVRDLARLGCVHEAVTIFQKHHFVLHTLFSSTITGSCSIKAYLRLHL